MTPRNKLTQRALMLLLPTLLLMGCAHESPNLSQPPEHPAIPPLPAQARQPAIPSMCLPTCSRALTAERETWQHMLTLPASPEQPASAPTTH